MFEFSYEILDKEGNPKNVYVQGNTQEDIKEKAEEMFPDEKLCFRKISELNSRFEK